MSRRPLRLLMIVSLTACRAASAESETTHAYSVRLRAELPDVAPMPGARFWFAGRDHGPTDGDGHARATIRGHEGDTLEVAVLCPPGLRGPKAPRQLTLPRPRGQRSQVPTELTVTLRCEPDRARAALVVRARRGAAGIALPIVVDGRVVGQTDRDGVAHVLLHHPASASVQVRLDTQALPQLTPRDPVRIFDLENAESVLLFDQEFEPERRRPHARPNTHRQHEQHLRVPYRIQ